MNQEGVYIMEHNVKNNSTLEEFQKLVEDQEGQVIVDFWATWCGPCRMVAPVLQDISENKKATIVKVDVDQNPVLAQAFGIQSIPTLMFFQNGAENRRKLIGAQPKEVILKHIA